MTDSHNNIVPPASPARSLTSLAFETIRADILSGALQPETQANVRAEVSGAVLATYAEQGQHVTKGQTLARIDDAALRQTELSARAAVTASAARRNSACRRSRR